MLLKAVNNLKELLPANIKFAVAVSGGVDSMTLLHLVMNCGLYNRNDILVVNVNHGIRGENSNCDSEFVRNYCTENGIKFKGYLVNVPENAKKSGRGLEHEARIARYDAFADLLVNTDCKKVLLAHHATDNVESVLMHLLRGAGINGICGMQMDDGKICRPLLSSFKDEVDAYAAENKVPFVTDETNSDTAYDRNFLRHDIMPRLKSRWAGCEKAILRLAEGASEMLADTSASLDLNNLDLENVAEGLVRLRCDCLNTYFSSRYIFCALSCLGIQSDIYAKHISAVRALCTGKNGSQIDLGQGIIVLKEYDYLTFTKTAVKGGESASKCGTTTNEKKLEENAEINFTEGESVLGGVKIFCEPLLPAEVALQIKTAKQAGAFCMQNSTFSARPILLDYNKVPQGAVVRNRKKGDMFFPFGGKGVKKLKEFLIDKKIPLRLRDNLPCLCYNNCILAVYGVEIADSVRCASPLNSRPILITITEEETKN